MTERVTRSYGGSDSAMLQTSKVLRTLFLADKELFTAIDRDFADPFADNWETDIAEAENIAKDVMLIDEMAARTENLRKVFEKCRLHFQKMKYYIDKVFANSKAKQNEFGYNDYKKVRVSEEKMMMFLKLLHTAALKHSAELIAAGCSSEVIETIELLRQELDEANNTQEIFKKERNSITEERVKKLNRCRAYSLKVNRVSKIIFANQYAKLKAYAITATATTVEPESEEVL